MPARHSLLLGVLTTVALVFGFSPSAYAQATRTWVSGVGDDANPCSRTAPCKTFAGAISKTAARGEINVLDPGGFGGVTITKSISIISEYIEAGVLVSGTNGIVINLPAATDEVLLQGLDIEGLGTGINGVHIVGGGSVIIRRTSIRHFAGNGVNMIGNLANTRLFIEDSTISSNGGGVFIQGLGNVANNALLNRTTIDTHPNFGINIAGPGTVFLSNSFLIGGGPKLVMSGGGAVTSYGNNVIRAPSAAPSSLLPLQ